MRARSSTQADARHPQNNILVTQDGQACLGDFGIAGAFGDLWYDNLKLGTVRYMAPEQFLGDYILSGPIRSPSKESDVYSLAMTSFAVCSSLITAHPNVDVATPLYQVLTGIVPYGDFEGSNPYLAPHILSGRRPLRPTDPGQNRWLPDQVWDMITACWAYDPGQRSELSVVCHVLSTSSISTESVRLEQQNPRGESPVGLGSPQDTPKPGDSNTRKNKNLSIAA